MRSRLLLLIALILLLNLWQAREPEPRRPLPGGVVEKPDYGQLGSPLPGITMHDAQISVGLGEKTNSVGTAFALYEEGWWMTARHVVDQCAQIHLRFVSHRGLAVSRVVHHSGADLALLRTGGDPVLLPVAGRDLYVGQNGFKIGYPAGRAGEVWSTLLGRRRMRVRGRYRTNEPVVAWAERSRRPAHLQSLGGLSGGPTLDGAGEVVGVLVAESPRRGRVYTAAPISMRQILPEVVRASVPKPVSSIRPETLVREAKRLRRAPSVAKVECLVDGSRTRRG